MTFGEKIKQLRKLRGLSQYQLAKLAGIPRGSLASIEINRSIPKTDMLLKLADAFNIPVEELYEAAGYEVVEKVERREETPEELMEKLAIIQPVSIPVYTEFQQHSEGVREEPVKYIYRRRDMAMGRNIEAYIIRGQHLKLDISDGDIVLVDRNLPGEAEDVVLCLVDKQMVLGRLVLEGEELWLSINKRKIRFVECRASAKVIEVRKQME